MADHKVECFYAKQTKHLDLEKTKRVVNDDVKEDVITEESPVDTTALQIEETSLA